MAFPAEVYAFGINYYWGHITFVFSGIFICWCVLPVFYKNNISSCYEYLELRFDRATKNLATIAFLGSYILFLPMYLYLPSVALSHVTNINAHIINVVINGICVFYTMLGGLKAVIWTDVVQGTVMVCAVVFVSIQGILKIGGLGETYRIAREGHRLDVDFTLDLETRLTFWNSILHQTIALSSYIGFNQSSVQRMMSLPTLKQSKQAFIIFIVLFSIFISVNDLNGVIMYAYYHDCDPILTGQVRKHDELMPHFVQDTVGHLKGVPGIFIAGLFSAAMSTVSAAMNSLAGVIYFDYIKPLVQHTDKKANLSMKLLTVVLGIYNVLGGFVYEKFPSFVQLYASCNAIFYGAMFSCFVLGVLVPRVHGKCIFWGMVTSIIVMIIFLSCAYGKTHYEPLGYTTTEGCGPNLCSVTDPSPILAQNSTSTTLDEGFNILKMSFTWYIVVNALIVVIVSIPLSYILPNTSRAGYDRKLVASVIHPLMKYQLTQQDDSDEPKIFRTTLNSASKI